MGPLGALLGSLFGGEPPKREEPMTWVGELTPEEVSQRQELEGERQAIAKIIEEHQQEIIARVEVLSSRETLLDHAIAKRFGFPYGVEPAMRDNVNGVYVTTREAEKYRIQSQGEGPAWRPSRPDWADKPQSE